jgi:pimeloyl-ACP methyl ester carboxylesterase
MTGAFLIPGFSPSRSFDHPDFDLLRDNMQKNRVYLDGVREAWDEYSVRDYGRLACLQIERSEHFNVLIGHSVGAIAALAVIEDMPVKHLLLCSPSALFSEDITGSHDPAITKFIGSRRLEELSKFSVQE